MGEHLKFFQGPSGGYVRLPKTGTLAKCEPVWRHAARKKTLARAMASTLHTEVLAANAAYVASFGDKAALALPPARAAAFLGAEPLYLPLEAHARALSLTPTHTLASSVHGCQN